MKPDATELKRDINRSVMFYIIGCCCFVSVALVSLWFGYYVVRYHNEHGLPLTLIVISLAGVLLLWELVGAFRFKTSLPGTFRPITEPEYPALFDRITEVTTELGLSPIRRVYICPDAMAAVFVRPRLYNILFSPKRDLVIGLGFLTQMDDDEIRAMLYHEFGHYAQEEMKSSLSVYAIGQFSRSFVSIKELKRQGIWEMQMKLQLLLFTYFTIWICNRINRAYAPLARQMEYDADDVAAKHVGAATLQRALLHAACIRYNYEVVQWGIQRLRSRNIQVDNPYLALSFVGRYSRPARRLLSEEVIRRAARLGELGDNKSTATKSVQQSSIRFRGSPVGSGHLCPALQFAQWLRQGFAVYAQRRLLERSVELEIHLDRKRHKLPYFDGLYQLLLDGKKIGSGNFIKGYTLKRKTSPGKHILTAYAPSGIISTPFEFETEQDKAYRIEMDYKLHLKESVYDVFAEKIDPM